MAQFNFDSFIANMPDAFNKKTNGNNYKLLMVEKHIYDRINAIFQSIFEVLDIDNADGKVLDMYGERLNLKRGTSTDEQYLIRLKAKITQNLSDGTRDSIAKSLAYVLSSTTDKIKIVSGDKTGSIEILDIPLGLLYEAKFTSEEIISMIESLLPLNVHISQSNFSGTFEFGEVANEYDETKGFADDEQTIGGYFGLFS